MWIGQEKTLNLCTRGKIKQKKEKLKNIQNKKVKIK